MLIYFFYKTTTKALEQTRKALVVSRRVK